MNDMSAAIEPKSDQINADDLISGPMSVTIKGVAIKAGTEQPVSIDIGIPGKVYRPCKSMSRVLVAAWGADAKAYTGRSLTLFRDPKVKWGGMEVGGIRISHMSGIDKPMTMALTETRANRKPYTVKPLQTENVSSKSEAAPQTTSEPPHAPKDIDPAIYDYADLIEAEIDGLTGRAASERFNAVMKTEDWSALRHGDEARAAAIKAKALERAKAA